MVAASKLLEWPLKHIHCSQIPLHCGETCFRSFLYDFFRFTKSGLGYYSPLILAPLVSKGTNMTLENFIDTLKFFFGTILSSTTMGCLVFGLICLFRNLSGKFGFWTTFVLPGYLGAQSCWWFPKRTLRIFVMATTQVALEALLRQHKGAFTYFLLNSKIVQTLIFMISSTIIMHYKRLGLYNGFWFIKAELATAAKNTNEEITRETENTESIWKYLLKDSKTYFVYGLGLDILQAILKQYSSYKSKGLFRVLWSSVKGLRFNLTSFFVAYVGIYKLSLHYLSNYEDIPLSVELKHGIAAFFGGASYIFLNKLTCNTFAVILAVQILWETYCHKMSDSKQEKNPLDIIKKIPFGHIFFPINIGYMVYSFYYNNDSINALGKNLLGAVTCQKTHRILDYINKHEIDFIVKDVSFRPIGVF